jgi:hypothetical protein
VRVVVVRRVLGVGGSWGQLGAFGGSRGQLGVLMVRVHASNNNNTPHPTISIQNSRHRRSR